jgi:hypothetical protein
MTPFSWNTDWRRFRAPSDRSNRNILDSIFPINIAKIIIVYILTISMIEIAKKILPKKIFNQYHFFSCPTPFWPIFSFHEATECRAPFPLLSAPGLLASAETPVSYSPDRFPAVPASRIR